MRKAAVKWLVVASAMIGFNASVSAQDAGKAEYFWGYAACHGADGKGKGPMGAELKTAPADLTTLAKRNNGVFPLMAVYEVIDGRKPISSHGSRAMPIWGFRYTPSNVSPNQMSARPIEQYLDLSFDPEAIVRNRILAVVDYLNRIQEK